MEEQSVLESEIQRSEWSHGLISSEEQAKKKAVEVTQAKCLCSVSSA